MILRTWGCGPDRWAILREWPDNGSPCRVHSGMPARLYLPESPRLDAEEGSGAVGAPAPPSAGSRASAALVDELRVFNSTDSLAYLLGAALV